MVAVAVDIERDLETGHRPLLRLVPPHRGRVEATEVAFHRGRIRPPASVYVLRRIVAVALVGLATLCVAVALHTALERIGGGPLATTGATGGMGAPAVPAAARAWVVRPGDTLWSIAVSVDPHGDVRPLVDRLSAEVGNAPLYAGEVIQLPARS